MTRTTKRVRRALERFDEALGQAEAFAVLFAPSEPKRQDGVIELVEVSPGVYAAPVRSSSSSSSSSAGSVLGRVRAALVAAEELEQRSRQLAKDKPWRRR